MSATNSHGSHPGCGLTVVPASALTFRQLYCSVCQAVILPMRQGAGPVQDVNCCTDCSFYLCAKCFAIDEKPLATAGPHYVVRNPCLPMKDDKIVIHTRPKSSAHVLGPLVTGAIIEIKSLADSEEDGISYCRQAFGGWIRSQDVLLFSADQDRVLDLVISQHVRYLHDGEQTFVMEAEDLDAAITRSLELLQTNAPFGLLLGGLTLLPLALSIASESAVPRPVLERGGRMAYALLVAAQIELERLNVEGVTNSASVFYPATIARVLSLFSTIAELGIPLPGPQTLADTVAQAVATLSNALMVLKPSPRLSALEEGNEMEGLWDSVVSENTSIDGLSQQMGEKVHCALWSAVSHLKRTSTTHFGASIFAATSSLVSVTAKHSILSASIGSLWIDLMREWVTSDMPAATRHFIQAKLVDSDFVEMLVRTIRHSGQGQEHRIAAACNCLAALLLDNPANRSILFKICRDPLVWAIQSPNGPNLVNAALNALTAFCAFDSDPTRQQNGPWFGCEGSSVSVYRTPEGPRPLCSSCAVTCVDLCNRSWNLIRVPDEERGVVINDGVPSYCVCPNCKPGGQPSEHHSLDIPSMLNDRLKALANDIASGLVGKLRVHRFRIAAAVARLAMRLELWSHQDLALELYWTLMEVGSSVCESDVYADACIFLDRVSQFNEQTLTDARKKSRGSPLASYLQTVAQRPTSGFTAKRSRPPSQQPQRLTSAEGDSPPSAELRTAMAFQQGTDMGLTPSPGFGGSFVTGQSTDSQQRLRGVTPQGAEEHPFQPTALFGKN